jgi:hypothetical protein
MNTETASGEMIIWAVERNIDDDMIMQGCASGKKKMDQVIPHQQKIQTMTCDYLLR